MVTAPSPELSSVPTNAALGAVTPLLWEVNTARWSSTAPCFLLLVVLSVNLAAYIFRDAQLALQGLKSFLGNAWSLLAPLQPSHKGGFLSHCVQQIEQSFSWLRLGCCKMTAESQSELGWLLFRAFSCRFWGGGEKKSENYFLCFSII